MWVGMSGNTTEPFEISIVIATNPQTDVVELVEATVFGTDGLQYQRLNVRRQLDRFNDPTYFHAMAGEQLVGVYVLDRRDLLIDGKPHTGYYRGVLAVKTSWQGRGAGRQMTAAARTWLADKVVDKPVVSYGCIDKGNTRSLTLLNKAGATAGPALSMYMMYRQWPAERCELIELNESHQSSLKQLADAVYGVCTARDVTASPLPGFALEDAQGIVISARVAKSAFRITRMSAAATWCTSLFVKPFSVARKRFDPENFRYVAFSDVLIRPGSEALWRDFVSTVLANYNYHFGALYIDPNSALFSQLRKATRFSHLLHSSQGSIQVLWQCFPDACDIDLPSEAADASVHLWPVDA